MSAAQDKTKRNSDGFDFGRNSNNKGKKQDSAKRTAKIAAITIAAVAVLFIGAAVINSNYFRQNATAVRIDDVKYSIADFNYYYENAYIQYYNAVQGYGDLGTSMLPQQGPLQDQIYDEATGETWADFFEGMALDQMRDDTKLYKEALKAGYQLTEEDKTKMESDIENVKSAGYANGYSKFDDYLKSAYSKSMTEAYFRKCVERAYLITSYVNHVNESYQYTPEQIETYYVENKDLFDTFTFRYFLVTAAEVNESDYPDDAAYEAAKGAAVEAAGVKAGEYMSGITDEQSFIDAAREYDPEANKDDKATERVYKGELLGSTYGDWLRDPSRKDGDVSTFKSTNGYYVVMFHSRDNNHYPTVNVQTVLVKQEAVDKTQYPEDDNGAAYNEAVETAKQTAQETIDKIYQEWLDGGASQDKLAELITSHSQEISAADSKLNENVYKGQMPDAVNSWIYDAARQAGDHEVIYVEGFGYYIVHFVGTGKQYSDDLSDTRKREKDLQAWKDSLTVSEPKVTWLMTLTK